MSLLPPEAYVKLLNERNTKREEICPEFYTTDAMIERLDNMKLAMLSL